MSCLKKTVDLIFFLLQLVHLLCVKKKSLKKGRKTTTTTTTAKNVCYRALLYKQTNKTFYAFHVRHDVKANVKSIFY